MLKHSALFPIVIARHLRLPARRAAPLPCPPAHIPPSQWAAHVTYLGQLLSRAGIAHLTLGNSLPESMAAPQAFGQPRAPRVLLMSSQRHASGINLQCARHVVIVHPHCTATARSARQLSLQELASYERQAIGRVRRFPQQRQVETYRFFAPGTVEEEVYSGRIQQA